MSSESPSKELSRLETLSDGIVAIAITLLVLELKVPQSETTAKDAGSLASSLVRQWPSYVALVTSFATIFVTWMNHHIILRQMKSADSYFAFSNALLLLFVALTPFPTAVVAEHLNRDAAPIACLVYSGFLLGLSVSFNLVWHSATRNRSLLKPGVGETEIRRHAARLRLGFIAYFLATLVAFVAPYISFAICSTLWIFWGVTAHRLFRTRD